jgi:hypothetical protein
MNKCLLYECPDLVADGKYKFCSGTHWQIFQNRKLEMDSWFSANQVIKQLAHYNETKLEGNKPDRANHSIEEIELLILK